MVEGRHNFNPRENGGFSGERKEGWDGGEQ
jgi:hypothetical protein